jgi:hypothetical protein
MSGGPDARKFHILLVEDNPADSANHVVCRTRWGVC